MVAGDDVEAVSLASDGSDVVDASGLTANSMALVIDGGPGDDTLIDGEIVSDGLVVGQDWLDAHVHKVGNKTELDVNDTSFTVPAADLVSET